MNVALGTVESALISAAVSALCAALIWAVTRGVAWMGAHTKLLNVQQQAAIQEMFSEAMMKASVYGVGAVTDLVKAHGWDSVQVKSAATAAGLSYAVAKFPDLLTDVGINPANPTSVSLGVTGALDRLFPQAVAIVAASPATPDASVTAASLAIPAA